MASQIGYSGATVVINSQPSLGAKRDWDNGLCSCCLDIGECCFAYFCPLIYQCKLFPQANESCCSCIFGGLVPLRTKIRIQRNIEGSICGDFFTVYCCPFCAMIQMGHELSVSRP